MPISWTSASKGLYEKLDSANQIPGKLWAPHFHSSIVQGSVMPACKAASPQCVQLVNRESQRQKLRSPFTGLSMMLAMKGQGFQGLSAANGILQQPFKLSLHSHSSNKLSACLLPWAGRQAPTEAQAPSAATLTVHCQCPPNRLQQHQCVGTVSASSSANAAHCRTPWQVFRSEARASPSRLRLQGCHGSRTGQLVL